MRLHGSGKRACSINRAWAIRILCYFMVKFQQRYEFVPRPALERIQRLQSPSVVAREPRQSRAVSGLSPNGC
jgi:hypothetical protein